MGAVRDDHDPPLPQWWRSIAYDLWCGQRWMTRTLAGRTALRYTTLPSIRIAMAMEHGNHRNRVAVENVSDHEGKPWNERQSCGSIGDRMEVRIPANAVKH